VLASKTERKEIEDPLSKGLVIIESPGKAKAIQKYLGKGYTVEASFGHVKDLPKSTLGVDTTNGFETDYVVIPGKEKVVAKLKKLAASADFIFLAPDPDREGEAIAAHLAFELGGNGKAKKSQETEEGRRGASAPDSARHLQRNYQARCAGGFRAPPRDRSESGGRTAGPARA